MLSRAGCAYEDWAKPQRWSEIHPAAYDPKARLAIQDEENVAGEVIYPAAGMVICLHPDVAYRKACFEAYNRWLAAFCATDPKRLVGIGMVAIPRPRRASGSSRAIARQGFKGVMLCGDAAFEDYDHPSYAPIWEAAIELGLPDQLPHPDRQGQLRDGRARTEGDPADRDRSRQPEHHHDDGARRRLRTTSRTERRHGRERRRLASPFLLPSRPRLGASPLVAGDRIDLAHAVGIRERERLHDLPGRLERALRDRRR